MDRERLHRPVKRLGQNFLRDPSIASQIVSLARLSSRNSVLEPGAGFGTLTERICKVAGRVVAVEKDKRLASYLKAKFADAQNVRIVAGDVLKVALPTFDRVVGTPPYNISSKLILFLISSTFEAAHLVFQKEFGKRLLAQPGTAEYGRLSVSAQRKLNISGLLWVPRSSFEPVPKVDSMLLGINRKTVRKENTEDELFEDLVRGIFTQRRRLLKGALSHYLEKRLGRNETREVLGKVSIPDRRVYELAVQELEDLAVQIDAALNGRWDHRSLL